MRKGLMRGGLVGAMLSTASMSSGCYSPQPKLNIEFERSALKYEDENVRISAEPLDTSAESKRAFWYDVTSKKILPIFLRLENRLNNNEISFNKADARFYDNQGVQWIPVSPEEAAMASSASDDGAKAFITGFSLGLLALPLAPVMKKGFQAEAEKKIKDFQAQMFPEERQVIYPEGVVYGNLLFTKPKDIKGFLERVDKGELAVPYRISGQEFERKFKIESPSDYLER